MLAEKDIWLAQEGIESLHAQGQVERAHAIEAVLAVATSATSGQPSSRPGDYLTVAQAARALGG